MATIPRISAWPGRFEVARTESHPDVPFLPREPLTDICQIQAPTDLEGALKRIFCRNSEGSSLDLRPISTSPPVPIVGVNWLRTCLFLRADKDNTDDILIAIGDVQGRKMTTASRIFRLEASKDLVFDLSMPFHGPVWALSASGTQILYVLEW